MFEVGSCNAVLLFIPYFVSFFFTSFPHILHSLWIHSFSAIKNSFIILYSIELEPFRFNSITCNTGFKRILFLFWFYFKAICIQYHWSNLVQSTASTSNTIIFLDRKSKDVWSYHRWKITRIFAWTIFALLLRYHFHLYWSHPRQRQLFLYMAALYHLDLQPKNQDLILYSVLYQLIPIRLPLKVTR